MKTFKILGAGPAGLTAAIILARAGRPVVVYERAQDVGTRHHGDLEALENWSILGDVWDELSSWGLVKNFPSTPMHALTAFGPGFRDRGILEDLVPLYYWCTRGSTEGSLDRGLFHQAQEAGARIEFNQTAHPQEVDIVASGLPRPDVFALGYNFQTHAPDGAYICLDDSLSPDYYSYLVICQGSGTIAATAHTGRRDMRQNLSRLVEKFRACVDYDIQGPRYFAASVRFGMPKKAQVGKTLYIGEAGGFQDNMAGFGIRMGMTTGYLAACSLLEGRDFDELWRSRYGGMLRASAVNRWALELFGNHGYSLLLKYTRLYSGRGRALLHLHYHPRWYTPLLWPLARKDLARKYKI